MDRRLQWVGAVLIVATIGLWVAEAASWIPVSADDRWSALTLKAGLIALAASLALRVLQPIAHALRGGHCSVCGRSTKRGHAYCLDHLQDAVNATRDRTHDPAMQRPKPLRSHGR
jgi:hypothetical protein